MPKTMVKRKKITRLSDSYLLSGMVGTAAGVLLSGTTKGSAPSLQTPSALQAPATVQAMSAPQAEAKKLWLRHLESRLKTALAPYCDHERKLRLEQNVTHSLDFPEQARRDLCTQRVFPPVPCPAVSQAYYLGIFLLGQNGTPAKVGELAYKEVPVESWKALTVHSQPCLQANKWSWFDLYREVLKGVSDDARVAQPVNRGNQCQAAVYVASDLPESKIIAYNNLGELHAREAPECKEAIDAFERARRQLNQTMAPRREQEM